MPSAYLLAYEKVEQSRSMLESEIWFNSELDRYFTLLLERLELLDSEIADKVALLPRYHACDNAPRLIQRKLGSSVIPFGRR